MRTIHVKSAQSFLNRVPAGSRLGFDWSLNPYRGCTHACRYCYARETHRYFDLSVGEDFERVLFVKSNFSRRLPQELRKIPPQQVIILGTATDPYQPLEGRHQLTRAAIAALAVSGHPFTLCTKSPLVERDLDLLGPLGRRGQCQLNVSLITLDEADLRRLEPGTASPTRRLQLIHTLAAAGIPTALLLAPVIPHLTDAAETLDALFHAAQEAGVACIMASPLRLSDAVRPYFLSQLAKSFPAQAQNVAAVYQDHSHPDPQTLARIHTQLARLYQKYGIPSRYPSPRPFRVTEQMHFSL